MISMGRGEYEHQCCKRIYVLVNHPSTNKNTRHSMMSLECTMNIPQCERAMKKRKFEKPPAASILWIHLCAVSFKSYRKTYFHLPKAQGFTGHPPPSWYSELIGWTAIFTPQRIHHQLRFPHPLGSNAFGSARDRSPKKFEISDTWTSGFSSFLWKPWVKLWLWYPK